MKFLRSLLLTFAVLALCAGTASAKGTATKGARLDPSFGDSGSFTVSTPLAQSVGGSVITPTARLAVAPSGESYVLQNSVVIGFGANGKPDPRFGEHGRVAVDPGPGQFGVSGVAVDSLGRILVAGTYEPIPGFKNPIAAGQAEALYFGNEPATEAFVIRYLPTGEPDPTFGVDGVVISNLGVPRPTDEPFREKAPTAEYERPVLRIRSLGVDSEDRPVLAGSYVYAERTCYYKQEYSSAIVARLTPSGSIDRSFGVGGHTVIPGAEAISLASGPGGELAAFGEREHDCYHDSPPYESRLAVLSETGLLSTLDPGLPELNTDGALAIDSQGRILFAEQEGEEFETGAPTGQPKITRLLPDGEVDTSFGHDGGIVLTKYHPAQPTSIAVDAKGRIVVGLGDSGRLELTRISASGKLEGSFGNHGLLLEPKAQALTVAVAIDSKGRILAAGTVESQDLKTGQGIVIARFLPGS